MVTKDLFEKFVIAFEKYHGYAYDDDVSYLLDVDASPYSAAEQLSNEMEDFLKKVTNLQQRINLMKNLIIDLQRKQSEKFTSIGQDDLLAEEYDKLLATIKQTSTYLNDDIKGLKRQVGEERKQKELRFNNNNNNNEKSFSEDNASMTTNDKIKRDHLDVLLREFQDVMNEYNRVQLVHRDQCKSRIKRQFMLIDRSVDNEKIEEMLEQGNLTVFHQDIAFEDIEKANKSLQIVEERHADILKLEQSIKDLFEIFQEIATLVDSQSEMIDNIQRNVQETMLKVEETKKTLKIARRYRSRTIFSFCCPVFLRKSMCCNIL